MRWIGQNVREMCDCLHSFQMTRECQQSFALERTGHTRFAAPVTGRRNSAERQVRVTSRGGGAEAARPPTLSKTRCRAEMVKRGTVGRACSTSTGRIARDPSGG